MNNDQNQVHGEMQDIWIGEGDTETNEGRGPTYIVGYFREKWMAEEAVKTKGVMGHPGYVKKGKVFVQYYNGGFIYWLIKDVPITLDDSITKEQLRRSALKKLSQAEIDALGIKA